MRFPNALVMKVSRAGQMNAAGTPRSRLTGAGTSGVVSVACLEGLDEGGFTGMGELGTSSSSGMYGAEEDSGAAADETGVGVERGE
jgi:hypothetical protein